MKKIGPFNGMGILAFLVLAPPAQASISNEFDSTLSRFLTAEHDFDAPQRARDCVAQIQSKMLELAAVQQAAIGQTLVGNGPPAIKVDYTEKFSEYGAHIFSRFSVPVRIGTVGGVLEYRLDTTAQLRTIYEFIEPGTAIRKDTRVVWGIPSVPKLDGHELAGNPDQFVTANTCRAESQTISKVVHEYPPCVDPRQHCGEGD